MKQSHCRMPELEPSYVQISRAGPHYTEMACPYFLSPSQTYASPTFSRTATTMSTTSLARSAIRAPRSVKASPAACYITNLFPEPTLHQTCLNPGTSVMPLSGGFMHLLLPWSVAAPEYQELARSGRVWENHFRLGDSERYGDLGLQKVNYQS